MNTKGGLFNYTLSKKNMVFNFSFGQIEELLSSLSMVIFGYVLLERSSCHA